MLAAATACIGWCHGPQTPAGRCPGSSGRRGRRPGAQPKACAIGAAPVTGVSTDVRPAADPRGPRAGALTCSAPAAWQQDLFWMGRAALAGVHL